MATLTITTRDDSAAFAAEQARLKGLASAEEYIAGLLREAHLREARRKLDALLIAGIESGPGVPLTPESWAELEREVFEHLEAERRVR